MLGAAILRMIQTKANIAGSLVISSRKELSFAMNTKIANYPLKSLEKNHYRTYTIQELINIYIVFLIISIFVFDMILEIGFFTE